MAGSCAAPETWQDHCKGEQDCDSDLELWRGPAYPWDPHGVVKGPGSAAYQGLPVLKEQQRLLQTNQAESKELRAGGVSR